MITKNPATTPLRWQTFSDHLLIGITATEAYVRAGYCSTSRPSAQAAAARLRQHPRFAAYHSARQRQRDAQAHRSTLRIIRAKLRRLDQIIYTSAATSPRSLLVQKSAISHRKSGVAHLPCKLTALYHQLKLTGHLDLIKASHRP
jgi:hypothetical protein